MLMKLTLAFIFRSFMRWKSPRDVKLRLMCDRLEGNVCEDFAFSIIKIKTKTNENETETEM